MSASAVRSARARGVLREIKTAQDTVRLYNGDPQGTIVLLHTAGATTIAPLFSRISGIICTKGGVCSHLAILAREFQLPCIMAAKIGYDGDLEGKEVMIELTRSRGRILIGGE